MPTYDYVCKTCGHRFEHFQSITSAALTTCVVSECPQEDEEMKGKGEVQRVVSGGAGLLFKGDGFYLTDYVRKGGEGKESASPSSKPKADAPAKDSKAKETKTDSGTSSGDKKGA